MKTRLLFLLFFFPASALFSQIDLSNNPFVLVSALPGNPIVSEVSALCTVKEGSNHGLRLRLVSGLANPKFISLELVDFPGYFLRHQNSQLKVHPLPENDELFKADATFKLIVNKDDSVSFQSVNYPNQFISVTHSKALFISADPSPESKSFYLR